MITYKLPGKPAVCRRLQILVLTVYLICRDQNKINTVKELTPIDDSSRASMIGKVDTLAAEGGTCLDLGLLKGREVRWSNKT